MGSLIVKNGNIVLEDKVLVGDLYVANGQIADIAPSIKRSADRVIDAEGCHVLPGGIDAHTHLELPQMGTISSDTFASGTRAALFGGTTTIIDFSNQIRGESLGETLRKSLAATQGNCHCDYSFHVAVTDVNRKTISEIQTLVEREGITSFKTFMAYDHLMLSDDHLLAVMKEVGRMGGLVTVHAEIGNTIKSLIESHKSKGLLAPRYHPVCHPVGAEVQATKRAIDLASDAKSPVYFVHVSCEDAVKEISAAKTAGKNVLAETCPQYLVLDNSRYEGSPQDAVKYVMSPPLRSKKDNESLWSNVQDGTIDVLATDHCPFTMAQKMAANGDLTRTPNGAPGIENRIDILFSEGVMKRGLSLNRFARLASTNPAKIFGLYPQKGVLREGSDADIVIIDPARSHKISAKTHHMNVDYSSYEGMPIIGQIAQVLLRGEVVVEDGRLSGMKGFGRFLKRSACICDTREHRMRHEN